MLSGVPLLNTTLTCLLPDSKSDSESDGLAMTVNEKVRVTVGGIPLSGIIDKGADITVMGGAAFKQVQQQQLS